MIVAGKDAGIRLAMMARGEWLAAHLLGGAEFVQEAVLGGSGWGVVGAPVAIAAHSAEVKKFRDKGVQSLEDFEKQEASKVERRAGLTPPAIEGALGQEGVEHPSAVMRRTSVFEPGKAAHQGTEIQHRDGLAELLVPFDQGAELLGEPGEETTLEVLPESGERERHAEPIKIDRKRSNKSESLRGFCNCLRATSVAG
jgi:hypothetical protein